MSLFVTQENLLRAVQTASEVASKGSTDQQKRIRVFHADGKLQVMAAAGAMATCRHIPLQTLKPEESLDTCVQGDRLLAACKALRKGDVQIGTVDGALRIEQDSGVSVELELENLAEFPTVQGFENMKQVYSGPNPAPGFEAIKHVASSHAGTTPLSTVLIMLNNRSYLAAPTSSVRCDFSLVCTDGPGPVPIILDSTWVLTHFEPNVVCYHEKNRILVMDTLGWATISLWGGDLGGFPTKVETTFASLRQVGQIKVPRVDVLRAASAAQVVLKGTTKDPVFMTIETRPEQERILVSANVGRHAYKESLAAWSSHVMKIPVHVGRFAEFLRGSEDEAIYIKLMTSDIVPRAQEKFVHFVDSRLHEVVGLPGEYTTEFKENA